MKRALGLLAVALAACGSDTAATGRDAGPPSADAPVPDAPPVPPDAAPPDALTVALASAITVATDPSQVTYPDDYLAPPKLGIAVDPYCVIASDTVTFPASYLGAFPLPAITGAPAPASMELGIVMKDFFGAGLTNPSLNRGCSGDMHVAFRDTVARVKLAGAKHLTVTSFDYIMDASSSTPTFDPAQEQLSADDMTFIAGAAADGGVGTIFWMQVSEPDESGGMLPSAPSPDWLDAFLDAYTARLVRQGTNAEAAHIDAMTLNWLEYYLDLSDAGRQSAYAAKMMSALTQLRTVFHGQILYTDNYAGVGPVPDTLAPLYGAVDGFIYEIRDNILTPTEDLDVTLPLVKSKYEAILDDVNARLGGFHKPIRLYAQVQSHRYFFETGWIEDSPDFHICDVDCPEKHLMTDFSVQAIGTEAFMEAVKEKVGAGLSVASVDTNYWYTDELLPFDLYPNMAHTVRNKPAEVILFRWFMH